MSHLGMELLMPQRWVFLRLGAAIANGSGDQGTRYSMWGFVYLQPRKTNECPFKKGTSENRKYTSELTNDFQGAHVRFSGEYIWVVLVVNVGKYTIH